MLFPLEIWDIIITYADIDALVRLSGVSSYFLKSCEPYLETASRACFPWAQKSLLGEPDGSEGTWRLSALRIIAMRHLRPDFINPTGTQKNCKDTPLRRFPDFNSNDHTSRPFFYDATHTVIKGESQCKSFQLRSQVNWRLANWRVAMMPRSCISADVSLPSRKSQTWR